MRDFIFFAGHFFAHLHFVRGVFLTLLLFLLALALIISLIDDISLADALYLVFITALTVGYGDLTPSSGATRIACVLAGFVGVIFVGLVVAASTRALREAYEEKKALLERERQKTGRSDT